MNKSWALWIKRGLLVLAWIQAATPWLPARQPAVAGLSAASDHTRSHTWTFAADAFRPDETGYVSPVERAPFPFTAAGVHLKVRGLRGFSGGVALRLRAAGGEWSAWYPIDGFELEADGRSYGENLVAWPQAREVQVRVSALGALQELSAVAIDARDGPTAAQAVLSARTRAAMGMLLAQGDPGVPQPTTISRADWGADESWMTWPPEYAPVDKLIVHHTVNGDGGDPAAEVRAIYYFHAVTRGWGDIGYNFLVDRFGNVYEGRYGGPDVIGAHVLHWNTGSLGVAVLGCYDNGECDVPQVPTPVTLNALADLFAWASSRQGIDPRALRDFSNDYGTVTAYVVSGHRDYDATTCPGGNLYAELPNLRQVTWERLPDYDVRFGWQDTPSLLEAGQKVTVYPNLYNHGRLAWSDGPEPRPGPRPEPAEGPAEGDDGGTRLGYRWLKGGQVVAENTDAARIIPGAVVNFGEMTALVAQLSAPTTSGTFTLRWDLYRDGVGWFAEQPAPAGRSQPLDLPIEVVSTLSLDVQMDPPAVAAGAWLNFGITLEGRTGQAFTVRTDLSPGMHPVPGSGRSDPGSLHIEPEEVSWTGILSATPAQASFALSVSAELSAPLALPTTTTLNVEGYVPFVFKRWLIVNGYQVYLPLVGRAWMD